MGYERPNAQGEKGIDASGGEFNPKEIKRKTINMKSSKLVLLVILAFISLNTFAQVDAIKIASAKKAIENKDYQIAIDALNEVSGTGKKGKMFLYYKGYAHYNLSEYDSAEIYLKKYLLLDITNDQVAETLGNIDYQKKKLAKDEKKKDLNGIWTKLVNNETMYYDVVQENNKITISVEGKILYTLYYDRSENKYGGYEYVIYNGIYSETYIEIYPDFYKKWKFNDGSECEFKYDHLLSDTRVHLKATAEYSVTSNKITISRQTTKIYKDATAWNDISNCPLCVIRISNVNDYSFVLERKE